MSKRILSVFLALVILASVCVTGIIVSAGNTATNKSAAEDISVTAYNAAIKYIKSAANDSTAAGLLEAVSKVKSTATIEQFFIKHAVDGVYDEATDYPLYIKGQDGYASAVINLGTEKVGVAVAIPHNEENLGNLTTSVYSPTNTEFTTNSSGNITKYTGTAEKLVIPESFSKRINWAASTNNSTVKVIIIGGNDSEMTVTIGQNFKKFTALKAVVLPHKVNGLMAVGAFSNCENLEYVKLPHSMDNSGKTAITRGAFKDSKKLKTAYCTCCGKMTETTYNEEAFKNTAIRDYYLPENIAFEDGVTADKTFGQTPSYGGTATVMTAEDQKSANITRAATLVMQKLFEHILSSTDTADTLLALVRSAYTDLESTQLIGVDWKNTLEINGEKAKGTLYVTENDAEIPINYVYNPNAGLMDLDISGYNINPSFDAEVTEYTLSVPYTVEDLKVTPHPLCGAKVVSISGNDNLEINKDNKLVIDTVSKNGAPIKYTVTVRRLEEKTELNKKVTDAFKAYINEAGNNVQTDKMVDFINKKIAPATVTVSNDEFFIKHAVDGVFDEDPDETTRLSIKGHDGYASAVLRVFEDGNPVSITGTTATIPHTETNLGILTKSTDADFVVDADGNLTAYTGNAQKVIIPSTVKDIKSTGVNDNAGIKNAIVLVTKNSGKTIGVKAFASAVDGSYGWANLLAADVSNNINFAESCFSALPSLKYVKMPKSSGTNSYVDYGAFRNCVSLENINLPSYTSLMGVVFSNTAVRDFYEPSNLARPRKDQFDDYGSPSFSEGTRVVMTYAEQKTASFTRAATLAQEAANSIVFEAGDNADTIKAEIVSAFSSLNSEITADWNGTFKVENDIASGVLTLKYGDALIGVDFNFDASKGLKDLYLYDYELSPKFSEDVTDYSITVKNGITSLPLSIILYNGAEVASIDGNSNFQEGSENLVRLTVKAKNGDEKTYSIAVTRKTAATFDEMTEEIQKIITESDFDNSATIKSLDAVIGKAVKGEAFEFQIEDFYLYKAIGGATENGTTVLVPGHNGYITATVKLIGIDKTDTIAIKATVAPDMEDYTFNSVSSEEDFEISEDGKTLLTYMGTAEKVVIPEGIEFIDPMYLYTDVTGIRCVIFPESLRELPTSLCLGFTDLEVVYMGDNVVEVGAGTFMECPMLKYIRLSENLPEIGSTMFSNCISLAQLYIPQSVTRVRGNAFYKSLIRDVTLSKNITLIDDNIFGWAVNRANIFVAASQGALITAEKANIIQNTVINKWAYKNGAAVPRTVTILNNSITIGVNVFAGDDSGAWGINFVRAAEGSSTQEYINSLSLGGDNAAVAKNFKLLDMSATEAAARAQIAADGIHLKKDATADTALEIIKASYISNNISSIEWVEPFNISGDKIVGTISITDLLGISWKISLNTTVFVPAKPIEPKPEEEEEEDIDLELQDELIYQDSEENEDEDLYSDTDYYTSEIVVEEEEGPSGEWKTVRKKIKTKVRVPGEEYFYIPIWGWILIGLGAATVIAGTVLMIIFIKRKKKKVNPLKA